MDIGGTDSAGAFFRFLIGGARKKGLIPSGASGTCIRGIAGGVDAGGLVPDHFGEQLVVDKLFFKLTTAAHALTIGFGGANAGKDRPEHAIGDFGADHDVLPIQGFYLPGEIRSWRSPGRGHSPHRYKGGKGGKTNQDLPTYRQKPNSALGLGRPIVFVDFQALHCSIANLVDHLSLLVIDSAEVLLMEVTVD